MAIAFDPRTLAAIDAVQAGLDLIRARHRASDVREKAPGDLVTGTDLAIQSRIETLLKQRSSIRCAGQPITLPAYLCVR